MKSTLKLGVFLAADLMALSLTAITSRAQTTPVMPKFFARRDYPGLNSFFVQVADTNGDKIPDLIVDDAGLIQVQFGNGDGAFRAGPKTRTSPTAAYSFIAVDLNGDGKADLELPNGTGIIVSIGNGDGTFQSGVSYPIGDTDALYSVLGDFNGDGILDSQSQEKLASGF